MNFIAPFKMDETTLHIAIPDSSKLSLMRNLKSYEWLNVFVSLLKLNFQAIKSNLRFIIKGLIKR